MSPESREYLTFDELPRVRPCLLTAVDNAEGREVPYYGLLSPHFYYIINQGQIETCIDRTWLTAPRLYIRKFLVRFKVLEPRDEYRCE